MAQRSSGGSGARTTGQRGGQGGAGSGRGPRPGARPPASKSEAGKAAARQAAAARAAAAAASPASQGQGGTGKSGAGQSGAGKSGAGQTGAGKSGAGQTGAGKGGPGQATAARTAASRAGDAPDAAPAPTTLWGRLMRPTPDLPDAARWFQWTTWILSLAGLGVSIYLTIEHFTSNTLAGCAENSTINCTKVTTSAQSEVFGVVPVAVLGLAFFVFMAVANSPWAWQWKAPVLRWLRLGSVVIGIGFVLYLVYAELIEIKAICLYCTSVHILTFLLFVFVVFDATFRHPAAPAQHH
jgi:uncharacterized membrane protein